jgi:hypothetical protein
MPSVTLPLILIIFGSGALAGSVGSMLGLGGGVLPSALNLALGFPLGPPRPSPYRHRDVELGVSGPGRVHS